MRISTPTIFESGSSRLSELQIGLLKTQQQISTNRRMLTPADDPVGASKALELSQSRSINARFAANRGDASDSLTLQESVLASVSELLQDAKTLSVQAGNGSYTASERQFIAAELRGRFDQLVGLGNTRDGNGNYLFSGFQVNQTSFVKDPNLLTVQFMGDQSERTVQAGPQRMLAIADSGYKIFENISAAGPASARFWTNTGTGTIGEPRVVDAQLLTGATYSIDFTGPGTYQVFNTTADPTKSGAPVASGTYTSPTTIAFDGLEVQISGAPATNDSFGITEGGKQSMFKTLSDLIGILEAPAATPIEKANLNHGLSIANANLDKALDNVLTVRASVGSRLKEIELLNTLGEDVDLQYTTMLSQLQDVDYVKAITTLSQQKTTLEAAQQTFVKVSGLSLFNYLT